LPFFWTNRVSPQGYFVGLENLAFEINVNRRSFFSIRILSAGPSGLEKPFVRAFQSFFAM